MLCFVFCVHLQIENEGVASSSLRLPEGARHLVRERFREIGQD